MERPLVPGRICGDCNVCCSYYQIVDPMLAKPKRTLCPMWSDGCTIRAARPKTCRDFFCLWRLAGSLDDGWRPDRIGVVIQETMDGIPPDFARRVGLIVDSGGAPEAIADERVVIAIADQVHQKVPVFLRIAGEHGFMPTSVLVNGRLEDLAARRDMTALRAAMLQMLRELQEGSRERPVPVDTALPG